MTKLYAYVHVQNFLLMNRFLEKIVLLTTSLIYPSGKLGFTVSGMINFEHRIVLLNSLVPKVLQVINQNNHGLRLTARIFP